MSDEHFERNMTERCQLSRGPKIQRKINDVGEHGGTRPGASLVYIAWWLGIFKHVHQRRPRVPTRSGPVAGCRSTVRVELLEHPLEPQ